MVKVIYILVVFIFLLSIVSSASPFTSSQYTTTGIVIEHPQIEFVKTNTNHVFNFHIFNQTNGKIFNNVSFIYCSFHLYDSKGDHLIQYDNLKASELDFEIDVNRYNFTSTGYYSYIFSCNDSNIGGFYQNTIKANPQGKEYNTTDGLIYNISLLILFAICILSLYGSIKIPFKNHTSAEGNLIKISWEKYLKLFLFAISYVCLLGLTFFMWNISIGILEFNELGNFFYVIFRILYIAIFPISVSIIIISVASFVADKKYEKLLKRGINIR